MKELSKSSIDYYILPNKILCGMTGLWPTDEGSSSRSRRFMYMRLIFTITALHTFIVPEILLIAVNWGDLTVLTGIGIVLTTMSQLLFKMFYLIARRKKACSLYDELRDLWNSSDVPRERQSYEEFAYWARIITIAFYGSGMCNVLTFTIASAFDYITLQLNTSNSANRVRHLPFDGWPIVLIMFARGWSINKYITINTLFSGVKVLFPLNYFLQSLMQSFAINTYGADITRSPCFEIAFVYQIIAGTVACAGICGFDATFMTIILHISGQFKLINMWISVIGIETNYDDSHVKHPRKFKAKILRCIQHHQRIINIVKEVNNLLTPIIFMQLLTSGVEFCLSGFAVMNNNTSADLVKFTSYLASLSAQLLVWCWPGEILVYESQQIGHAIYSDLPWYDLPSAYRKLLCLMILRSQQYCSITALTFQTLSIHTLTSVFNTAASYFALLRQMQQE